MKFHSLPILLLLSFSGILFAQSPMLLKDFHPNGDGNPSLYIPYGNHLYFKTYTANGANIQRTDGNIASTVPLCTNTFLDIMEIEIIGGTAYFSAYDNAYNLDLYKHNLTPGTAATKITVNSSVSSEVSNLVRANGRLYFNAFTNSNGFQICSIDLTTQTLFIHTAPPPYNTSTGLIIESNSAYPSTGLKSLVEVNGKLIFNCRFQFNNLLSLDISGSPTFPVVLGPTTGTKFAPYPYNGKVYLYSDGDLISSDGTSITTEITDVGPYFFREFQGRLYFSGEQSSGSGSYAVLYSIDNTNTIREFTSIPVFGGTTTFNRNNNDYALVEVDGQLHALINNFPATPSLYGVYSIDLSSPNSPTMQLELADVPKEMYNLFKVFGYYYYWYLPFQTGNQQLKKGNSTNDIVLAQYVGEGSFSHFMYWEDDLYFTGKLQANQFNTCENYSGTFSPGTEWFKLSESQLDCQSARVASPSFFLKDNILATQTSIDIDDPILLNTTSCHILSTPNLYINDVLQVVAPAVLISNTDGCQ